MFFGWRKTVFLEFWCFASNFLCRGFAFTGLVSLVDLFCFPCLFECKFGCFEYFGCLYVILSVCVVWLGFWFWGWHKTVFFEV